MPSSTTPRAASTVPSPRPETGLTVEVLTAQREAYRALADNLPRCSLHVFDRDLRFVFAGGPALAENGFDASQLEGRTLFETLPPAIAEEFAVHYRRALAGEDVDFDVDAASGKVFQTRIRPVRGADGSVVAGLLVSEDVTAQRQLLAELADTAELLSSAQRLAGLGTFVHHVASGTWQLNDQLTDLWGLPRGWQDAAALQSQLHPDDVEKVLSTYREVVAGRQRLSLEHRIVRADDGRVRHLRVDLARQEDAAGKLLSVRGTHLDVTDLVQAQEELAQAQSLSQAVFAASPDTTLLVRLTDVEVLWSSAGHRGLLGWSGAELHAMSTAELFALCHPEDVHELHRTREALLGSSDCATLSARYRMRARDGVHRWMSCRARAFRRGPDDEVLEAVVVIRDVDDVVQAEQRLEHSALHDPLTGLPNRVQLLASLHDNLRRRASWGSALLYVDVDHFKRVNDQFGHPVGDVVLTVLAQRLQSVLREGDLVARVGGDEFVVALSPEDGEVLGRVTRERSALALAERLRTVAAEPVEHAGRTHVLSASIGIRVAAPGLSSEDALRDADAAMYRAKQSGRDTEALFDPVQREGADHDAQVEQLLRQTLAAGGLGSAMSIAYQPVYDLADSRLLGVEALARLTGDSGPVSPEDFIAVAEQSALIKQLGEAVLAQACADLAAWRRACPAAAHLQMSVNLSARQAQDPGLATMVLRHIRSAGLAPTDLVLELTETVLLSAGLPALSQLRSLRAAGVGIAIDDFGVGYASLRYLATLPVTCLKVDRSFTAGLPHDPVSTTIVRAIAGLAADMGLTCVVEGIETAAQRDALPDGTRGQGYLLGRPQDAATTLALVQAG